MALGGFKFAGFKCTKPEGATDAQWALLIHKTRLKAFLAANTLAGNVWVQDWNGGTIDFNSGDGMIYDLSSDVLNLVSFFKHNSEEKYYMIASLFSYFCSSSNSWPSQLWLSDGAAMSTYYDSTSASWKIYNKQLFHAVSYDRFSTDCLIRQSGQADRYPTRAIGLVPIGGFCTSTATNNNVGISAYNSYGAMTSFCAGYALKNKDIISFGIDSLSRSEARKYIKTSLVGFDSLTLSSPNDTANIYGLTFTVCSPSISDIYQVPSSCSYPVASVSETLKDNFSRYEELYKYSIVGLTRPKEASFGGTPDNVPYEAVKFTASTSRNTAPFLNSDGICSKGTFNIELMSMNSYYNSTSFSMMSACANGNYLLVYMCADVVGGQTSFLYPQVNYYIGWDPSNPDITADASWTAYDGT